MIHYLAHLLGFAPYTVPVVGTYEGDSRRAFALWCPTCKRLDCARWIGSVLVEEPESLTWRKVWGNEIVEVRRG